MKRLVYLVLMILAGVVCGCSDDDIQEVDGNSPIDKHITAIKITPNTVWVGTQNSGLYRFRDGVWSHYNVADGMEHKMVLSLEVDRDGRLWVGSPYGIVRYYNGVWERMDLGRDTWNRNIRCLSCDNDGVMWVGTGGNRLVSVSHSTATIHYISDDEGNIPNMGHIHTVVHDLEETVWAGSCYSGLSKMVANEWQSSVNGLNHFVTSSLRVPDGSLWFGTPNGAYHFAEGEWHEYTVDDGLVSNAITCFAVDHQAKIWIGTTDGVSHYDGAEWVNYIQGRGLLNDNITAMSCDSHGNIWIGTTKGLARLRIP